MNIWFIMIAVMVLSFIIQQTLQSKFSKYSRVPSPHGLTGADIARLMLKQNGITDVTVQSVAGQLTDHFNPQTKTINLRKRFHRSLRGSSSRDRSCHTACPGLCASPSQVVACPYSDICQQHRSVGSSPWRAYDQHIPGAPLDRHRALRHDDPFQLCDSPCRDEC